ncbi:MAG: transporter substrate-binding domain-containing protein [Desulfobacteraceae bacterium]
MGKIAISLFFILLACTPTFSETLHLVTFDYYPTMYKSEGEVKGCAVDIVKEAFRRMGQEITIRMVPMKRGQNMVKKGTADGMFTLYKTPKRAKLFYYPKLPVLSRVISFYVKKESRITFDGDVGKMLQYSLGTVLGYSYGNELDNYIKKESFRKVDPAASLESTIKKLVKERFELLPHTKLDMIQLLRKMKLENKVRELTPSIIELPVYLAFTQKRESLSSIADKFSNNIAEMRKDGCYEKLLCELSKPE